LGVFAQRGRALRDLRAIFSAAAHAQRAADYLHGLQLAASAEAGFQADEPEQ
jgi:antirestriction protein ArdC